MREPDQRDFDIAVIKTTPLGRGGSCIETNRFADNKRDGFGLRLAHHLGRGRAAFGRFQHLVRQFMHKGGELLRFGLAGENGNPAAITHAKGGGDVLGKDKFDVLLVDERNETGAVLADFAAHLAHGGKLCALSLRNIKDVARCNEGYLSPLEREPQAERKGRSAAEVCTSAARKIGETPCAARSGQSP
jgi:hypothetical protein